MEHKEKPEFEIFTIKHFFEDFDKKRTKRKKISFSTYKAIIKKFLTIYINELLFLNRGLYFPLMGKAKINRCGNWIRKDHSNAKVAKENKLKVASHALGIYWYHRPFKNMAYVTLKKMTGTTNVFPVLEKQWKEENEAADLPTTNELKNSKDTRIIKTYRK